ncbi:MAG: hypothetical protein AB1689_19450 [Thermodesulfobacteriota bacterium]
MTVAATVAAKVSLGGARIYLGRFSTREEARAAQRAARDEHRRTGTVQAARSAYREGAAPVRLTGGAARAWLDALARRVDTPAARLMVAVLKGALEDLGGDARVRTAAERWLDDDGRDHAFAFATICDVLDVPVDVARAVLLGRAC